MGRLMGESNRKSSRHKHRVKETKQQEEQEPTTFDGELPLFCSSFRDLKQVEVGWPLGRQEIAAWANSFRFELDGTDTERLQEVLADHRSGESAPSGESFRFVTGYLKPPRQLEKHPHGKAEEEEEAVPRRIKLVAYDVAASPRRSEILRRLRDLKAHPMSPTFAPEEDAVSMAAVRDELHGRLKTSLPLLKDSSPAHEIISNLRERRRPGVSSSGLRANPRKPAQLGSQEHPITASSRPTTPTSRFRNHGDDQPTTPTSRFKVQPITPTSRFRNGNNEQPTTPTMRFSNRLDSRSSAIQEQIVSIRKQQRMMSSPSPEHTLSLPGAIPFKWEEEPGIPKITEVSSSLKDDESAGKIGSFRFYGRHSREGSLGRSSRRYSTQEALIDLDASAAAKFLVFESPSRSPNLHSPRNFAVPFKWEATPGKPKVESVARSPGNLLQLPPRLAVPSLHSASHSELRGAHPFVGFFAPCLTGAAIASPVHYTPSRSLPPKARRYGLVGRCSSAPREGCQIRISRSFDDTPGRKLFISDSNQPSSPTSILCGPEESSSQTSTSISSGELRQQSASSSYESIEEEFTEHPQATSNPASVLECIEQSSRRWKGRPDVAKPAAAKLDHGPTRAPENSLSKYLQYLELEDVTLLQVASSRCEQSSPRRATRLPYTMPSAAEQLLSSCSTSGRRQLIQDLSPRLLHQYSGRRLSPGGRGKQEQQEQQPSSPSPSPAYAASLELFSPSAAIVPQRRKWPVTPAKSPLVPPRKPRRRSRFILSICRNLKRVLCRRRHRNNPKEHPHLRLMYLHNGRSPSAQFRFNTTYT